MSEFRQAPSAQAPSGFEELARNALLEVTDARSVGPLVSETDEGDGVVSLRFESSLPGYLGWKWTVSIAKIGDAEPTVLESELMPGDGALLAPEWVPWSDRLDEYNAGRAAAEAGDDEDAEDDDDEDLLDEEDLEDDDLGDDEYDGVDVDAVLEEADDEDLLDDAEDSENADVFDDEDDADPAPASDPAAVGVEQPEQAEGDAGDAGPDEAGVLGADQAAEAEEQADERQ
jgi:Protein of unknown function (DUF3027)